MKFTYLDLVDKTILFDPVMASNWFASHESAYALFAQDEKNPFTIPGYHGKRCLVEVEMAQELSRIQKDLLPQGFSLKVYDTYRPQKAVSFFTKWTEFPDTPLAKKHHYPNVAKKDLHELSYLSRTSSHSKGTAVDLTIVPITPNPYPRLFDFLGYFDPQSVNMGVGYLSFDERSWHDFSDITDEQKRNRNMLLDVMTKHGFEPLDTEFWHYYYKPSRNQETYFDFDVRDDYFVNEDQEIIID